MKSRLIPFLVVIAIAAAGGALTAAAQGPAVEFAIDTTVSHRDVGPGGTITFTITVTDRGETAAHEVTICDRLPSSVGRILHLGGLHVFDRNACRTERSLAARDTTRVRLTVTIARGARPGVVHNRAVVLWSGMRTAASASYRIRSTSRRCR